MPPPPRDVGISGVTLPPDCGGDQGLPWHTLVVVVIIIVVVVVIIIVAVVVVVLSPPVASVVCLPLQSGT